MPSGIGRRLAAATAVTAALAGGVTVGAGPATASSVETPVPGLGSVTGDNMEKDPVYLILSAAFDSWIDLSCRVAPDAGSIDCDWRPPTFPGIG